MGGLEIVATIAGLLGSLLAGIGFEFFGSDLAKKFGFKDSSNKETYSEKLKTLTSNLEKSSKEVDLLLIELSQVAKEREENVKKIETDLANLQSREKEMKERIENLEKVPLPVAEYFAELTSQGEK